MIRDAMLDALALLLPVDCAGCGAPDRSLCGECRDMLRGPLQHHTLADGTPVVSALDYGGAVRNAILAVKENGRTDVARALGVPFALAMTEARAGLLGVEILAVPTSRSAFRRRGYDPLALLLRRAGVRFSGEIVYARRSVEQKRLSVSERMTNRAGSLRAKRSLAGRRFLLVDDIFTTGATLAEAARAVRAEGGEIVAAATLAHTQKRVQHPNVHSLNVS